MKTKRAYPVRLGGTLLLMGVAACTGSDQSKSSVALSGNIAGDGSSTVFPITTAVAEDFTRTLEHPGAVKFAIAQSGTGGGFKRFCAGETDLSNASRPIKAEEQQLCTQNGVEYIEMPVAFDGLSVVVHPQNSFVTCLTTAELKKIWEPESQVSRWSQVRAGFPDSEIKLYGPGTASGTFDYFTAEIMGKEDASRADYTASEDDNVLVQGVAGDQRALGYFGYAYYIENQQRLKVVGIDGGAGCVTPSPETIKGGTYKPLARPLLIYVNKKAMARPEVQAFLKFFNEHAAELVPQVGYVPLDAAKYQENLGQIEGAKTQ